MLGKYFLKQNVHTEAWLALMLFQVPANNGSIGIACLGFLTPRQKLLHPFHLTEKTSSDLPASHCRSRGLLSAVARSVSCHLPQAGQTQEICGYLGSEAFLWSDLLCGFIFRTHCLELFIDTKTICYLPVPVNPITIKIIYCGSRHFDFFTGPWKASNIS